MSNTQQAQSSEGFTMLVLNAAPELEENLIDYLLSFEEVEGFTSYHVHGHGEHHGLSVAEQVSGRRKRSQYEIFIASSAIPRVLEGLASAVGRDIVYWEQTARNFGHVG
tara:strand:+ start:534 stop:860 length:327 start_codon:yes stop_codon:yes gene_type:complete